LTALFLAGCAAAPPPAAEAPKTVDATAEFRPMVEKMLAGWASRDTSKVAPYYAKDAGLIFYDIAPLKYTGFDEYAKGFQAVSSDWKSLKLTLAEMQASRQGNVAWITYIADGEVEPKSGPVMKMQLRSTDVLEKRGEDWIVLHEHASIPMPEPPPGGDPKKK
jgi:ketosteroid isomerase-like protein